MRVAAPETGRFPSHPGTRSLRRGTCRPRSSSGLLVLLRIFPVVMSIVVMSGRGVARLEEYSDRRLPLNTTAVTLQFISRVTSAVRRS